MRGWGGDRGNGDRGRGGVGERTEWVLLCGRCSPTVTPPWGQVRHAPPPVLRAHPSPTFLILHLKSLSDHCGPCLFATISYTLLHLDILARAAWITSQVLFHIYSSPFKSVLQTKLAPFLTENIIFSLLHSLCFSLSLTHTQSHSAHTYWAPNVLQSTVLDNGNSNFNSPSLAVVLSSRAGSEWMKRSCVSPA